MDFPIKLVDPTLLLPSYQTKGSVAFDLYARIDVRIKPWKPTLIPLNVIVEIPKGYMLLLASRSSLPLKKNLLVANGVGIIDQDYCGKDDEVALQVVNFSEKVVRVARGERIAQGILMRVDKVDKFKVKQKMSNTSRGGFGSTGGHKS